MAMTRDMARDEAGRCTKWAARMAERIAGRVARRAAKASSITDRLEPRTAEEWQSEAMWHLNTAIALDMRLLSPMDLGVVVPVGVAVEVECRAAEFCYGQTVKRSNGHAR